MVAVRRPGEPASRSRRSFRSRLARHARPPSMSAQPARLATSASNAARTAASSAVGSAPVVPAHTAMSRSPSAICSPWRLEVLHQHPDPTSDAAGPAARFARLPRLRSSGLASTGQRTNRSTASLGGQHETGGGPLPMIKVGRSGLTNTTVRLRSATWPMLCQETQQATLS